MPPTIHCVVPITYLLSRSFLHFSTAILRAYRKVCGLYSTDMITWTRLFIIFEIYFRHQIFLFPSSFHIHLIVMWRTFCCFFLCDIYQIFDVIDTTDIQCIYVVLLVFSLFIVILIWNSKSLLLSTIDRDENGLHDWGNMRKKSTIEIVCS